MNEESQSTRWPDEFKELQDIDDALHCGICHDYLDVAMMTTCSHNYCSICIRKYMSYKSACPTCFVVTSEPELKYNRTLDQLVRSFVSVRNKLFHSIKNIKLSTEHGNKRKSETSIESSAKKKKSEENISETESIFKHSEEKVECPVCKVRILTSRIDNHVEACLKNSEVKPKEKGKGKHLPKLVYHLLSEKELRAKLKQHGLNTQGERQALIKRHHSFTILYNANCDSLKPKSISTLVRQVDKEERAMGSKQEKINIRKLDPVEQERQAKGYLKENRSHFNKLIDDIKQRRKGNPQQPTTLNNKQNIEIPTLLDDDQIESIPETDFDTSDEDDVSLLAPTASNFTLPSSSNSEIKNIRPAPTSDCPELQISLPESLSDHKTIMPTELSDSSNDSQSLLQ